MSVAETNDVTALFFGALGDAHGASISGVRGSTVGEVWLATTGRDVASALHAGVRAARNQTYCAWDEAVAAGDEVAFLPPVCGG